MKQRVRPNLPPPATRPHALSRSGYWFVSVPFAFLFVKLIVQTFSEWGLLREYDCVMVTRVALPFALLIVALLRPRAKI